MSTVDSTVSDNNSTTKELRKSSHVHTKRKVEIEETITDSTNTIGDSRSSYRQINDDRYCVGIDCRGRLVNIGIKLITVFPFTTSGTMITLRCKSWTKLEKIA